MTTLFFYRLIYTLIFSGPFPLCLYFVLRKRCVVKRYWFLKNIITQFRNVPFLSCHIENDLINYKKRQIFFYLKNKKETPVHTTCSHPIHFVQTTAWDQSTVLQIAWKEQDNWGFYLAVVIQANRFPVDALPPMLVGYRWRLSIRVSLEREAHCTLRSVTLEQKKKNFLIFFFCCCSFVVWSIFNKNKKKKNAHPKKKKRSVCVQSSKVFWEKPRREEELSACVLQPKRLFSIKGNC